MLTLEKLQHPSNTQINAAKTVFMAMAHEAVVREMIEPRQKYVLELINAIDKETGEPIRESKNSYRMSDRQFKEYIEEMQTEHFNLGFKEDKYTKDDYCPLLTAEDMTRQAKRALILSLEDLTEIKFNDLFRIKDGYNKYIDLCLRYLVNFVK